MEKAEKMIRTKAWLHYVALRIPEGASQDYWLSDNTDISTISWCYYRNGKRFVGSYALNHIEEIIPGSKDVYNIGPENAPLWNALWSDDEAKLWDAAKSISGRIQIYKAITELNSGKLSGHNYSKLKLDNADIYVKALIEFANELLIATEPTSYNIYSIRVNQSNSQINSLKAVDIHDLTALIATYRFCYLYLPIDASHLPSLNRCIQTLLNNIDLQKSLSSYGILKEVTKVLSDMIPTLHQTKYHNTLTSTIDYEHAAREILDHLETGHLHESDLGNYLLNKISKTGLSPITLNDINNGIDIDRLSADFSWMENIRHNSPPSHDNIGHNNLSTDDDIDEFVTKFFEELESENQEDAFDKDEQATYCKISPTERQQRIEVTKFANASVQLSGFELSQEYIHRQQLFIDGIINVDELVGE